MKPQVEDNKVGKEANMGEDRVYNKAELDNLNIKIIEKEKKYHRQDVQCYKCGKKGHFARDYQAKKVEGNAALQQNESKEEWNF